MRFQNYLNKAERLLQKPVPEKIKRVNFAITYACNSECIMCDIWKKYKVEPQVAKEELTLEEIRQLFTQSQCLRSLDEIILTGGEPFVRKDFVPIYTFFREAFPGAKVVVSTNGLPTGAILKKVEAIMDFEKEPPLLLISSIDGLEATHDAVRGVKGGYRRTLNTLQQIQKLYPIQQSLSFTIMPENYFDLVEVYELSKKLGVGFTMRFAQNSKIYYLNEGFNIGWTETQLTEVDRLITKVIRDLRQRRDLFSKLFSSDLYFYSRMVDYQGNPRRMFTCYSGVHSFFLNPWGEVYPCVIREDSIGNVRKNSFDELWLSYTAQQIRQSIAAKECHCWIECETCTSLQRDPSLLGDNIIRELSIL